MNKLTEKILSHFGKTGLYLYCIIIGVINLLPLIILDAPIWVIVLVSAALWFIPILQIPYLGIWVWAFVIALGQPIDWIAILYFVAFAAYTGVIISSLVSSFRVKP
jgi:formate-dependent nitrite reductase membrane component NrfD